MFKEVKIYYPREKFQEVVKDFAESIAWHYVNHLQFQSKPRVFIYNGKLYFDTNSPTFGTSEILYNHEKECEIIFDKDELDSCLEGLDIDFEDIYEYEEDIARVVENALENILEDYLEEVED